MNDVLAGADQAGIGGTAAWFAALSQDLMADQDTQATLERICGRAPDVVANAEYVGITVRQRRGRLRTLAQTGEVALACDELQYELGEGPCIDTALEDEPFLITSTGTDRRWPRWGPAVADLGVHALLSVQLPATALDRDSDPYGAINLYAREPGSFDASDMTRARTFAVHAGAALAMARQAATLGEAVEARHQIGVAQGVLIARYGLDLEQAFESLRRYSSHANVKLRDVAALVIEQGELPASYDDLAGEVPGTPRG